MARKDQSDGLMKIKSLSVQKDVSKTGKYWIWLTIHSKIQTNARVEARIIDHIAKYARDDSGMGDADIPRFFLGRHGLKVGENKLPPLPLFFGENNTRQNFVVHFAVKSSRFPKADDFQYRIVGPGLFVAI